MNLMLRSARNSAQHFSRRDRTGRPALFSTEGAGNFGRKLRSPRRNGMPVFFENFRKRSSLSNAPTKSMGGTWAAHKMIT